MALHRACLLRWIRYVPEFTGEPGWDRTNDHLIKSQTLYR
jgi:hypothetical protein